MRDGQPRLASSTERRWSIPAPGFDPEVTLAASRRSAAPPCTACPRCSSPMQNHATFPEHDLSTLRTGIMAGSICPVEVMKRCVDDMHMAEVSIAYGMTETSPVSCQTRGRRRPRAPYGHDRPGAPARRDQGRRPGDRRRAAARRDRRVLHPRLLRDARLLGRRREDGGGDRRRRLDAHRRPRGDAGGRLLHHRRPDQGHGHPGRREHLPARDRGVPLPAPRHRGRPGGRRPRREVRRGALRLAQDEGRRRPRSTPTRSAPTPPAGWPTTRSRGT